VRKAFILAVLCSAVAACTLAKKAAHAVTPRADPPESIRWNGVLFMPTDTMGDTASLAYGTAWLAPSRGNLIMTRVTVLRANPGARFDWRVHLGSCWQDRGPFGPDAAYPTVVADSTGVATGVANLPLGFPNTGAYFVLVSAIDSGMPNQLCGSLIRPW
jgi:hypothetical protein